MPLLKIDPQLQHDQRTLLRKRHLQIVESGKKTRPESYYRIASGDQLMKMCRPFLEDFKAGTKSFAISSTNYKTSQQRTVLGLASYFDHLFEARILIISDSLKKGIFRDLVNVSEINSLHTSAGPCGAIIQRFYHHFDFLDLRAAVELETRGLLEAVLEEYDLILWDPPTLSMHLESAEVFPKISRHFGSLSLVVSNSATKNEDYENLKKHFDGYGISIAGAGLQMEWVRQIEKI